MLAFLAGISSNINAFEYLTKREQINLPHMNPTLIRNVYQEHAKIIYAASATAIVLGLGWWLYIACIKGNNTTRSDQDRVQPDTSANASEVKQKNFAHKEEGVNISTPPDANITNKKGGYVTQSELHQDSSHSASTDTSGEPSDDEQYDSTKRDSRASDDSCVNENSADKNKEFAPDLKAENLIPSPAETSSLDSKPQDEPSDQNLSVKEDDHSELTLGTLFPLDGSSVNQDVTSEYNPFLNELTNDLSDKQVPNSIKKLKPDSDDIVAEGLNITLDDAETFDMANPKYFSTPHKKQHENDGNSISKDLLYSTKNIEDNILFNSFRSDPSSAYHSLYSGTDNIGSQEYKVGSSGTENSSQELLKSAISNESSANDHIVEKSAAISQGSQRLKKLITGASLEDAIEQLNSFHVTTPKKKQKPSSCDMTPDKSTSGSGYETCNSEESNDNSSIESVDGKLKDLSEDELNELSLDAQKIEQQSAEELQKFEDAQRKLRNRPSLSYMLGYDSKGIFEPFRENSKRLCNFNVLELVSCVIGMYHFHNYCINPQDHDIPELEYIINNQEFIENSDAHFFAKKCAEQYVHEKVNCDQGAKGPLKRRLAQWFMLYDFSGYKDKDAIENLREKYKAAIEYYINRSNPKS
ncbi:hypothetical protein J120_00650 [candidate division TM6 bacterium JCVI TM6SC1]|uniref:Uncharacterized protein n=1 Tax=candidate division TM6 bacterium JCVI TM6SC1 TaxID=1306947 RepID=A0A0D2K5E7_9BACT|nr:hypothetical protein J120_00650 [candidate division TM6 bacterium JCVI TM6SC1]